VSRSRRAEGSRRFPFLGHVEIIAHRGYSARTPENTLVAIDAAVTARADAVEFDLQVSADGVPVLLHDDTLERTSNGRGAVRDKTLAELRGLDAGSWFSADFAGEPVPTFSAALGLARGRVRRLYPEIKKAESADAVARMVDAVVEHELVEATVFISMDWGALEQVRALNARVGVGYIIENASRGLDGIALAAADPYAMVDFRASLLIEDPGLAEEAHRREVELAVWTVDDLAEATRLFELGVRRITTNRVADLVAWKASL
jgi:glycerophosphoryl diester phosphodiesterase